MPKRLSKPQWERFIRGRRVGVLATIGEGGVPVLTPIWYVYEDGRVLMRTAENAAKTQNIRRDPRVSFCVQDERPPYASVTLYGRAAIEEERPGLAPKIARRYLGMVGGAAYLRVAAEQVQQGAREITLVMTPERALTQDFSLETPLAGRLWLRLKKVLPPWL
jgi:PPOX class probable F420-dependent enzyme